MASNNRLLAGKVAIITGSSSGIGERIAVEFAREGASVTLNGRNDELLDFVAKKCEEESGDKNKILSINGDITQEDIRIKLIEDTLKQFGKLDILINNAGFVQGQDLADDFELSRLNFMLDIHVRAPFHLTKLVIPHLLKSKGNIINISSISGMRSFGKTEYGIAKAAMDHLTKYTALELAPHGIRANAISPGAIDTPAFTKLSIPKKTVNRFKDDLAKLHALGRIGKTEEVAKAAVFLASEGASFITGILMPVDGGFLLKPPLP